MLSTSHIFQTRTAGEKYLLIILSNKSKFSLPAEYVAAERFCSIFTCGRTCVVPPLCLGAASLCVVPLSRGWICHDVAHHKLAPGTRGNDTALRRFKGNSRTNRMKLNVYFSTSTYKMLIKFKWFRCCSKRWHA